MYNVIQFGHSQFALKRDLIKLKGRTSQLVSDLARIPLVTNGRHKLYLISYITTGLLVWPQMFHILIKTPKPKSFRVNDI
jgi:hypothetical protein